MRILILGASGFVGSVLYRDLSARHSVVGTCWRAEIPGLRRVDLRDPVALAALAAEGFDVVIHSAGVVDLGAAEADPDLAWTENVGSVETLVDAVTGTGTKLVLLSSDNVFDGVRESYTEADPTCPVNVYGRTKVAAEQALLAGGGHLAVRIPIVYGRSPWTDRFMSRFARPETPAQTDVTCAPLYLDSLPAGLEALWDLTGVVHYAGPDVVTRFELMSRIQAALDLPTCVVPVRNDDAFAGYARPKRLVLRSIRHGFAGARLDDALEDMSASS